MLIYNNNAILIIKQKIGMCCIGRHRSCTFQLAQTLSDLNHTPTCNNKTDQNMEIYSNHLWVIRVWKLYKYVLFPLFPDIPLKRTVVDFNVFHVTSRNVSTIIFHNVPLGKLDYLYCNQYPVMKKHRQINNDPIFADVFICSCNSKLIGILLYITYMSAFLLIMIRIFSLRDYFIIY